MVEISVKQLVRNFLNKRPYIDLPLCNGTITITERIDDICSSIQMEEINKLNPLPEKGNAAKLKRWKEKFVQLKSKGIGRERLVQKLPDYKNPNSIYIKLHDLYKKDPSEAGIYAQQYISYNPFISFHHLWDRPINEPQEKISLSNTNNIIFFQFDLLDLDVLYEFKLTKKKYLNRRLKEAMIQLFIYDFIRRLKFNVRQYFSLMIEILCIDENKIYRFGGIFSKPSLNVDKEILKEVFKQSRFENLDKIYHIIDDIYDNLEIRLNKDFNNDLIKLIKRDINPDDY